MSRLEVRDLRVSIGAARIVNEVSFAVEEGETVGIVGESGSGKSMTVLAATGLMDAPGAVVGGHAMLDDLDLVGLGQAALRRVHGRRIGFIFQDPATSLNPLLTLERQLTEGPERHLNLTRRAARTRALELLEAVGIPDPVNRLRSYPHQLSGGMKQRVMIAIALACDPSVLVADEPTTALDVTTQAQILDLVRQMQGRLGTSVIWISHDLGVIGGIADRAAVLYGGQIVEQASVEELMRQPQHPYTQGLLGARPRLGQHDELASIPGSPPDPRELPQGCVFYPRCPVRDDERCATERPPLRELTDNHWIRSWYDGAAQEAS